MKLNTLPGGYENLYRFHTLTDQAERITQAEELLASTMPHRSGLFGSALQSFGIVGAQAALFAMLPELPAYATRGGLLLVQRVGEIFSSEPRDSARWPEYYLAHWGVTGDEADLERVVRAAFDDLEAMDFLRAASALPGMADVLKPALSHLGLNAVWFETPAAAVPRFDRLNVEVDEETGILTMLGDERKLFEFRLSQASKLGELMAAIVDDLESPDRPPLAWSWNRPGTGETWAELQYEGRPVAEISIAPATSIDGAASLEHQTRFQVRLKPWVPAEGSLENGVVAEASDIDQAMFYAARYFRALIGVRGLPVMDQIAAAHDAANPPHSITVVACPDCVDRGEHVGENSPRPTSPEVASADPVEG